MNDKTVGELIDMLEPFRGRGDYVFVVDDYGDPLRIVGVHWDDIVKAVVIDTEYPE